MRRLTCISVWWRVVDAVNVRYCLLNLVGMARGRGDPLWGGGSSAQYGRYTISRADIHGVAYVCVLRGDCTRAVQVL